MRNPIEKTLFKGKINTEEVTENIEYGFHLEDKDVTKINADTVYTFIKEHFLGNVGFDYEYFCAELEEWFFDSEVTKIHDANSVLTEDLSGDIEELTSKRDVEGLEKLMDGLPECFLRYSIFQEIERLSVSKFARKKR